MRQKHAVHFVVHVSSVRSCIRLSENVIVNQNVAEVELGREEHEQINQKTLVRCLVSVLVYVPGDPRGLLWGKGFINLNHCRWYKSTYSIGLGVIGYRWCKKIVGSLVPTVSWFVCPLFQDQNLNYLRLRYPSTNLHPHQNSNPNPNTTWLANLTFAVLTLRLWCSKKTWEIRCLTHVD